MDSEQERPSGPAPSFTDEEAETQRDERFVRGHTVVTDGI